jgi:hypothetical protein
VEVQITTEGVLVDVTGQDFDAEVGRLFSQ